MESDRGVWVWVCDVLPVLVSVLKFMPIPSVDCWQSQDEASSHGPWMQVPVSVFNRPKPSAGADADAGFLGEGWEGGYSG